MNDSRVKYIERIITHLQSIKQILTYKIDCIEKMAEHLEDMKQMLKIHGADEDIVRKINTIFNDVEDVIFDRRRHKYDD